MNNYYNGFVICIDNTRNTEIYTVGKIYEFKDGKLTNDKGKQYPVNPVRSFNEWCEWTTAKFKELVLL